MKQRKRLLEFLVLFLVVLASVGVVSAQGTTATAQPKPQPEKRVGFEVTLNLLVAGNSNQLGAKVPSGMDAVTKQLKESLNVSSVGLASTLLHRVENNSGLQVRGVGTASLASPTSNPQTLPTFYDYKIDRVLFADESEGRDKLRLANVHFSMRFPIFTAQIATDGKTIPVSSYENISIHTSTTLSLGEPTIIGTTNIGRPDETLVVVITIRRVGER